MALVSLQDIRLALGGPALLDGVRLQIERGERICLLGRNGAGKSTLMKVVAGELAPDSGEVVRQQGTTIARLAQEIPEGLVGTAFDVVAGGLGELGTLLAAYHDVGHRMATEHNTALMEQLGRLHHRLDTSGGWEVQRQVETVLSHLSLDPDAPFESFSGGRKRQVLLARALVSRPDILLLDEPTNHLDIDAIAWLEEFLLTQPVTLLFVTHDRAFLEPLATRIVELDRGRLVRLGLRLRHLPQAEAGGSLAAEAAAVRPLRQEAGAGGGLDPQGHRGPPDPQRGPGPRPRSACAASASARRERTGTARLRCRRPSARARSSIEAEGVAFAYGGTPGHPRLLDHHHARRQGRDHRPQRLRQDDPAAPPARPARARRGDDPSTARTSRSPTSTSSASSSTRRRSVQDNIAERRGHDHDQRPAAATSSATSRTSSSRPSGRGAGHVLSGGERSRLLLAKLFTRPSNVLVLDEPTNDLDVETLELLEALLVEFRGTVLLVSHDRAFLNDVVTSTLVIEGDGRVGEYDGGYEDWRRQTAAREARAAKPMRPEPVKPKAAAPSRRKLSYKEQRELDQLPGRIEALEAEQKSLQVSLADPALYRGTPAAVVGARTRLEAVGREIAALLERWEALAEHAGG